MALVVARFQYGLNVSGFTHAFMALVVARFQYALPALAGKLSADDLLKVDAVFNKAERWQLTLRTPYSADDLLKVDAVFNKAGRWQLTSRTPYSADLIEQCDKHLFRVALNTTHFLHSILPPKKNMCGRNLRQKVHGRELPLAKTKLY